MINNFESNVQYIKYLVNKEVAKRFFLGNLDNSIDSVREIAEEIMDTMNRGTTFYESIGGYSGKECETLTCAVDRKQFYQVKEIIDRHDPRAFVIVSPTKEVFGEGFQEGR